MRLVEVETLQDLHIGDMVAEGVMVTQITRIAGDVVDYELRKLRLSNERGHKYRSIGEILNEQIIFPTKVLRTYEGAANEDHISSRQ